MKKSTANILAGILSGLKLNRIFDTEIKTAMLKNFLALRKVAKELGEEQGELIRKFRDDWMNEVAEVELARKEKKTIDGHEEFLKAEKEANALLNEIPNTEVDICIVPVSMDAFMNALGEEDLSFEQVAILAENGLLE